MLLNQEEKPGTSKSQLSSSIESEGLVGMRLDFAREHRKGIPEVIFAEMK